LNGYGFHDISLQLYAGEVLGLIGAVGAGKTELVRSLFGIDHLKDGVVKLEGDVIEKLEPNHAIKVGIALCPEDRKYQGLILETSIKENVTLASLEKFKTRLWIVNTEERKDTVQNLVKRLRITTPSINKCAKGLSGGNQQKVVLAKWLCTNSKIFIFDEPTIGVDIQGKTEIYDLIDELANNGAGVLFVTSDIEEGFQVCDRLLVMYQGDDCQGI